MSGGRWDQSGVPHKGWSFDQMEDTEDATSKCEMCGNEKVRYVHVMSHPTYGTLRVGCVCAEKMQDDYVEPRRRETEFKRRLKARVGSDKRAQEFNQIARNSWWDGQKLKWSGVVRRKRYYLTVFQRPRGWNFRVGRKNKEPDFGQTTYQNYDDAFRAGLKLVATQADPEMAARLKW